MHLLHLIIIIVLSATSTSATIYYENIWTNGTFRPTGGMTAWSAHPDAYQHPRLLFTIADRPQLRQRIVTDPVAQAAFATLNKTLQSTLYAGAKDNSGNGVAYALLISRNNSSAAGNLTSLIASDCYDLTGTPCNLFSLIAGAAYMEWLASDTCTPRAKELVLGMTRAADIAAKWFTAPVGSDMFTAASSWFGGDLAFAYDLLYTCMNTTQVTSVRSLLATMVGTRKVFTQNPYAFYADQFYDLTAPIMFTQMAIQGEPGYNATIALYNCQTMMYAFSTYAAYADGSTRDGMGYESMSMGKAIKAFYAVSRANICGNFLDPTVTNIMGTIQQYAYAWGPSEDGVGLGIDDGVQVNGGPGYSAFPVVVKFMFPQDPFVDYAYSNWFLNNANREPLFDAMFAIAPGKTKRANSTLLQTKWFYQKGVAVTYSDNSTDAIKLDFVNRADIFNIGHLHSDRNDIFLYGAGRLWFGCPGYHAVENDFHATIMIDGIPQSGNSIDRVWPSPPGRFLQLVDTPEITWMAGDAKPAYDWNMTIQDVKIVGTAWPPVPPLAPFTWADLWSFPNLFPGNFSQFYMRPHIQNPYNPVIKAFRTASVVRSGALPFVLIVDDITKDNGTHTYEWIANTIVSGQVGGADSSRMMIDGNATETQAILYRQADGNHTGSPRLLVRVVQGFGNASRPIIIEDHSYTYYEFLLNANVTSTTRRMNIQRTNVVSPDFRILLWPHRKGDAMPNTTWNRNGTILKVSWGNVSTYVEFINSYSDGRTRLSIVNSSAYENDQNPFPIGNNVSLLVIGVIAGVIGLAGSATVFLVVRSYRQKASAGNIVNMTASMGSTGTLRRNG